MVLDTCALVELCKETPNFSLKTIKKNVMMVNVGVDEWLDAIELDPADRVITAFAMKKQILVVSTDKKIKTFYKKVIW